MITKDDRTPDQLHTHTWLVIGTDGWMSGWGDAAGGTSVAAWACHPADANKVLGWVTHRGDMKRVREADETKRNYMPPKGTAHFHVYAVGEGHPALK